MASTRHVIFNRTRQAAQKLRSALEEIRATNDEFITLGGNVWTDPYFHESESTGNALRTDLEISKADLINAQIAFDVIGNGNGAVTPKDYFAFIDKVIAG